jgi:hypothetical protein
MSRHGSRLFLLSCALLIFTSSAAESVAQGCFISAPSVFDTLHPMSVAIADFNLDGKPDAITANPYPKGISLLLGNGDGTFQAPLVTSIGFQPYFVAVADFNRDGKPDVVVADYIYCAPSVVYILLGNGDGTFQPAISFPVDKTPHTLTIADFNGDGIPDIAAANWCSNDVSVLLGNGDGTFRGPTNYPVSSALAITSADFNGDGNIDLAESGGDGFVNILLGNGDGTFQPAQMFLVGVGILTNGIAAADLNHDGKPDLVLANIYGGAFNLGSIDVLLGNGDGTFQTAVSYDSSQNSEWVTIADLNGDGIPDLAVAAYNADGANIFLGNGDGTFRFAGQFVTGDGSTSLAAADVNRDGKPDLIVANNGLGVTANGNLSPGNLSVLIGNGDGTFQSGRNTLAARFPEGIASGDFNGDGKPDVVVVAVSGEVTTLLGSGDGFFTPSYTFFGKVSLSDVAAADFNHDGRLDLAVASAEGSSILVFNGNGDGTFQTPKEYPGGSTPRAIAVADLNQDGNLDLVLTNDIKGSQGTVSVLLGNPDGTFQPAIPYNADGRPKSVVIADFNHDGKLDLAVANFVTGNVSVLLGNGDGTFRTAVNYVAGTSPRWIAAGDVNHDGNLDLAVADFGTMNIAVLLGNGDGTFQPPVGHYVGHFPGYVAITDVNGDGKADLVATVSFTAVHGNGTLAVALGNGDSTFQPPMYYGTGLLPRGVAFADFNLDSFPDVATVNFVSNNVTVLLNNSSALSLGKKTGSGALGPKP